MNLIAAWVRTTGILDMKQLKFDNHDILRFCRARNFHEDHTKEMIENFAEWRENEQI